MQEAIGPLSWFGCLNALGGVREFTGRTFPPPPPLSHSRFCFLSVRRGVYSMVFPRHTVSSTNMGQRCCTHCLSQSLHPFCCLVAQWIRVKQAQPQLHSQGGCVHVLTDSDSCCEIVLMLFRLSAELKSARLLVVVEMFHVDTL